MDRRVFSGSAVAMMVCAITLSAAAAPSGNQGRRPADRPSGERQMRGNVIAVEPGANPPTITMRTQVNGHDFIVGADVTKQTAIREGTTRKGLADVTPGERVQLRWTRSTNSLVADQIRILPAQAAGKQAANKM